MNIKIKYKGAVIEVEGLKYTSCCITIIESVTKNIKS